MATTQGKRDQQAWVLEDNTREKGQNSHKKGKRHLSLWALEHNTREKGQNSHKTREKGPNGAGPRTQH